MLRSELAALPYASRSLFQSPTIEIGITRCDASHAQFAEPGPVSGHCVLFPATAIRVEKPGADPFISGAGIVAFHNRGDVVQRISIDGRGDHHTWFQIPDALARGVAADLDPSARDRTGPFSFGQGPSDAAATLAQRALVASLTSAARTGSGELDELGVEEFALGLLRHVVRLALGVERSRQSTGANQRDAAEQAKSVLARTFEHSLGLDALAAEVGCSQFYLARAFRAHTGLSLHQHRTRLRLACALERLIAGDRSLTELALSLGYSSHSHLTSTFRKEFGLTPSALRALVDDPKATGRLLASTLQSFEVAARPARLS